MIGRSRAFRVVDALIGKISAFDAPVLIEGETGTGKELAARALHYRGPRRSRPFVPVNCGALPDHLIENELFGHRRGAFTDARDDKPGLVEVARGGTLFLDEVDTLTPKAQVALLRFLQDQRFRPLGGREEEQADLRIVTASNCSLERRAAAGAFRIDLLYRLKLLYVELPPLRERPGDAALLGEHFIGVAARRYNKAPLAFDESTVAWFERYTWPGNIRELENITVRGFLLSEHDRVCIPPPASMQSRPAEAGAPCNYRRAKDQAITDFERRFLAELINQTNGNVSEAARLSGTERRHLGRLIKKYGIAKPGSSRI